MSDQFLPLEEDQPVDEIGIESILQQLLDLMAVAKSMPLSSSVMVSVSSGVGAGPGWSSPRLKRR